MSSIQQVAQVKHNCNNNAQRLRQMAQSENDNNVKKLLLEAAHHLDVAIAELEYITAGATVSI